MQIASLFENGPAPVSFEVFPPKGEMADDETRAMYEEMRKLNPSFVSVTYSAGGGGNSARTVEVARTGIQDFGLTCMAHLTCMGTTEADIRATLAGLREAGVENVLALRGDPVPGRTTQDFTYASDLIPLIREEGFCVGAAAYPEGHIDCLDFNESIRHLKMKQDAGAQFFVTQLFFDNEYAFRFLDAARAAGITVPITFGVMPFLSKAQIQRMVFMCGASLPSPIIKLLAAFEHDPESLRQAGIAYACNQMVGLAQAGVDGIHVYTMNQPAIARAAVTALRVARAS